MSDETMRKRFDNFVVGQCARKGALYAARPPGTLAGRRTGRSRTSSTAVTCSERQRCATVTRHSGCCGMPDLTRTREEAIHDLPQGR